MKKSTGTEAPQYSRAKGIYLLPNLFTTAGLFSGFYSIVAAMKGLYDYAAIAIFIAMIADSLDGRVARLTHTASDFGAEYDSLSDMVAFGVAPALFAYTWALHMLGKWGWLAAFLYTAATGLRLAKFNTESKKPDIDKRYFHGLPCPSAAGFLTGLIWIMYLYGLHGLVLNIAVAVLTVFVAGLMLSSVPYRSFKDSDFKNKVPFLIIAIVLLCFVCIALAPPEVLFGIFALYVFSGPVLSLLHVKKKHHASVKQELND